ncbi:hypothetical protein JCGZ_26719 [Jatropha curcas]|uniref:Uncharacterized protein n=1 Tax=Jatropha curcas TaxID=180498 RepID=A0A067JV64_JATCU|nr:hypothetical protein JCGZ_26719 [Jatropha curcas]
MRGLSLEAEPRDLAGAEYPDFVPAVVGYQQRWLLLLGLFYDMYYLGERVYKWDPGPDRRRVPHDVSYYMLSTWSIRLEQDIVAARQGSVAIDHLATCMPNAYTIFVQTQLMVLQQQRRKHVRRRSDSEAPDTVVIIRKLEYRLVLLSLLSQSALGRQHRAYWRPILELTWHLWQVKARNFSMAGELVAELDAGWLFLKRLRSLVAMTRRRQRPCILSWLPLSVALFLFGFLLCT